MVKLVVWGNNITSNLDPTFTEPCIHRPTLVKLEGDEQVESVVWASWACTIIKSGYHPESNYN